MIPPYLGAAFAGAGQKQQDAQLDEIGRTMRRSHARQWRELERAYREVRRTLHEHGDRLRRKALTRAFDTIRHTKQHIGKLGEASLRQCTELWDTQHRQRQELRVGPLAVEPDPVFRRLGFRHDCGKRSE